jgi:hypothetical protein
MTNLMTLSALLVLFNLLVKLQIFKWVVMTFTDIYLPLGTATVSEAITGSTENGSIFYAPTVTIMLNGLSKADQNQIKLLAATKVVIFAQLKCATIR